MSIFSSLCNYIVDFGTRKSNPRKNSYYNPSGAVVKITPHHMAGFQTAVQCAQNHLNSEYDQSASAYIDSDGIICGGVSEDRRPWTSGGQATKYVKYPNMGDDNDYLAITIEVANCKGEPNWEISDKAYNSLVRYCADICQRYNIIPHYDGTMDGTITIHKMFAATGCPGPYLESLITSGKFENDIKAVMEADGIVRAHVQSLGWLPYVREGETAGTTGQSRRLEAVQFSVNSDITAQAHCQTYGDMAPVKAGEVCGTTGQSKRLEAIKLDAPYKILYRLHLQGTGWTDWVSNGTWCGTKGQAKRAEALEVKRA